MLDRESILEAIQELEDPEELLVDLIDEVSEALETGFFDGVEQIVADLEEICNIHEAQGTIISWREFVGGEDDEENA